MNLTAPIFFTVKTSESNYAITERKKEQKEGRKEGWKKN